MKRHMIWLAALLGLASVSAGAAAPGISVQDKADISAAITRLVWSGFDAKDDVRDAAIHETQPPVQSATDLAWLDRQIDQEWSKKQAAEATWPARTDFNRLDDAFKAIRADGILAKHNAGNTQSDARDDASEEWHQLGGPKSGIKGFVFYHGQDVEGVRADGNLYIGFGTAPQGTVPALTIAQQSVAHLKKAGFNVTAPPDVDTRIVISGIDWKKRSPR